MKSIFRMAAILSGAAAVALFALLMPAPRIYAAEPGDIVSCRATITGQRPLTGNGVEIEIAEKQCGNVAGLVFYSAPPPECKPGATISAKGKLMTMVAFDLLADVTDVSCK